MYFRVEGTGQKAAAAVFVEVTYVDLGSGQLSLQYNAPREDYKVAELGYGRTFTNQGGLRTAVFRLDRPAFRRAQNLQTDLRLCTPGPSTRLQVVKAVLYLEPTPRFQKYHAKTWMEPYKGPSLKDVNATTLLKKVLCGYQGWFRCPGDDADGGWVHWSRDNARIAPDTLTVEMWPDLAEFADEEKYPAPGFTYADGKQAYLFSSANPRTVERHFDWMKQYGIDGVLMQRFVVGLEDPVEASRVLGHVRAAANRTGRVFAVEYDMSGLAADKLYDRLTGDWKWLVEQMKITQDSRYLHHNGKPVLAVWGFFSDRFEAALAHRIIDFFKQDARYGVTLIGGCPWTWREEKDREWARAFRRFDVISP
jgi:hypothetical protein